MFTFKDNKQLRLKINIQVHKEKWHDKKKNNKRTNDKKELQTGIIQYIIKHLCLSRLKK